MTYSNVLVLNFISKFFLAVKVYFSDFSHDILNERV